MEKNDAYQNLYDHNEYNSHKNDSNDEKDNKKKSNKGMVALALVCALIGGMVGSAFTNMFSGGYDSGNIPVENIRITGEDNVAAAVSKKAMPSVVGIMTSGVSQSMFGAVEARGTGSGIIVDKEGYILTNAHVVKMNGQVVKDCKVQLNDGDIVEGHPIWVDSSIDVAIVKIDTDKKLTVAELGDSSKLEIGETAIAIGNPIDMAYQRSVTQGIISGLNRYIGQVDGGGYMTGLIQTDASINGGNSGGPLLNSKGQVIGINTIKVQTAEGLGFSIPINLTKPIIESVIETGDYKVVSLGTESLDADKVQKYFNKDLGVNDGVFVYRVIDNSPAAKAGIQNGDVIVKIDDKDISSVEALKAALFGYKTGDKVKVKVVRDGKEQEIDLEFTDFKMPVQNDVNKKTQQEASQRGQVYQIPFGREEDIFEQFFK